MNSYLDEAIASKLSLFARLRALKKTYIISVVFKINFQIQKKKANAALTTTNLKLIPYLLTNLCWSDILFSIKRVHYLQLLFCNQFSDNFYTVPFRQSINSIQNNQLF